MKIDFDQLRALGNKMHQAYQEDGDISKSLDAGRHIYTISFEPENGRVSVHMQWAMFRDLVANEADHPATITKVHSDEQWLHCSCATHGVEICACLQKHEVVKMLMELVAEHPESDYEVCTSDDVLDMFTTWQHMTGWDLNWPEREGVVYGSN